MEYNEYLKFWSLKKIDPITVAYSGVFRRRYTGFDTQSAQIEKTSVFSSYIQRECVCVFIYSYFKYKTVLFKQHLLLFLN